MLCCVIYIPFDPTGMMKLLQYPEETKVGELKPAEGKRVCCTSSSHQLQLVDMSAIFNTEVGGLEQSNNFLMSSSLLGLHIANFFRCFHFFIRNFQGKY